MLKAWSFIWRWIGNLLRVKALWELLPSGIAALLTGYLTWMARQPLWIIVLVALCAGVAVLTLIHLFRQVCVRGDGLASGQIIKQETHCKNSPAFVAGRDVIYHTTPSDEGKPHPKLTLLFDLNDPECVRCIDGIPREYRVKVVSTAGSSAHGHVKLESVVPELKNYPGVRLRLRHGRDDDSSADLPDGVPEYFNLMEYNPVDSVGGPVVHLCHTAKTLPINVPVENYEFRLKAYSSESTSDDVVLKFRQLSGSYSSLEHVQK